LCFQIAADVERWPEYLPHYRWVRFVRRDGFAEGIVEMSANRPFGPLGWPTFWRSEMSHDREQRTVRYHHIGGVTTGMDVWWQLRPLGNQRTRMRIVHEWDGPRWPIISGIAADLVIGPIFVKGIASRTLAGLAAVAEAAARADSAGASHPDRDPPTAPL
ncbi:MAG: SRPBCC family protein, partial [Longimicrobiales bacterium]|nr:SRPBCC family protein [Longimicrobiales bacterium]